MRSFWLFRSNLRHLEYYHQYKDLQTFKENCHDYYLLLPLWLLENDIFDEVIIWRLTNSKIDDIIFNVGNKQYIQKWVNNLSETFQYERPEISFFRGGFQEYDEVTRMKPDHFGLKLYLGAGKRIFPQWGGKYDRILLEDERDFTPKVSYLPFYKTASPYIFKPLNTGREYEVCWPCNFEQLSYKGQQKFIETMSNCDYLRSLKIIHCGNKPEVGKKLCEKHNIRNITFAGPVDRKKLNEYLNKSKIGMNLSNRLDGCPRVSTEILMSGTPLLILEETRLLRYFKNKGVVEMNWKSIIRKMHEVLNYNKKFRNEVLEAINNDLSFDSINKKNIKIWKKCGG